MLSDSALKKMGCFIGGVLFGTAGVKVLSSKDAKKVYMNCTAAALRAKDCVMSVHELYSSSVAGKGLCNEDSYCYTGECRRHSC